MEANAESKIRCAQAKFVKREFTKGRNAHFKTSDPIKVGTAYGA
jgi:hypothetical protein